MSPTRLFWCDYNWVHVTTLASQVVTQWVESVPQENRTSGIFNLRLEDRVATVQSIFWILVDQVCFLTSHK